MPKYRATGRRGSWFADVNGESLPCVHSRWCQRGIYHDPNATPGIPKWDEHYAAIRDGKRVILTKSTIDDTERGFGFARSEYVAIFEVYDVEVKGNDLRFKLGKRCAELE